MHLCTYSGAGELIASSTFQGGAGFCFFATTVADGVVYGTAGGLQAFYDAQIAQEGCGEPAWVHEEGTLMSIWTMAIHNWCRFGHTVIQRGNGMVPASTGLVATATGYGAALGEMGYWAMIIVAMVMTDLLNNKGMEPDEATEEMHRIVGGLHWILPLCMLEAATVHGIVSHPAACRVGTLNGVACLGHETLNGESWNVPTTWMCIGECCREGVMEGGNGAPMMCDYTPPWVIPETYLLGGYGALKGLDLKSAIMVVLAIAVKCFDGSPGGLGVIADAIATISAVTPAGCDLNALI